MGKKLEHNAIKTVQYETLYTYFLVMIIFSYQFSIRVIRILRKNKQHQGGIWLALICCSIIDCIKVIDKWKAGK